MNYSMKNMVLMILLTLVMTPVLIAQNIRVSGTISDSLSKKPLPNASIKIADYNNFVTTIISNKKGTYTADLTPGLYKMEVSYLGYKIQRLDSVSIDELHTSFEPLLLALEKGSLEEVVVTAKKPFIVMGANKVTMNVAQSPVSAGTNAYELLKRAPGVIEENDALSFRGKTTNILINGRPSNLSGDELKTMLTNMQASNIEKIELLPNPSSKYDAQGGTVINIILAKNKSFGTNYTLTTGIGTGKYVRGNAGLDVNYRNNNVNIYGGYAYTNNRQYYESESIRYLSGRQVLSGEYDLRKRNNHSYKLGLDYDISKKTSAGFLVNGNVNTRDREVNNTSSLHYNTNVDDSMALVHTIGKSRISSPMINAYYKTVLDSTGKELTVNVDYLPYSKKWNDLFTNRYYDEKGMEYISPDYLRDNSPASIDVFSVSADYSIPAKKGTWETGLKTTFTVTDNDVLWENNKGSGWLFDSGKSNRFIYKEDIYAAYANYSRSIKKWNIEAGLRLEYTNTHGYSVTADERNRKNYLDWFPVVSAEYSKNPASVFGWSYRKSIKRFGFDYVNPFIIYQNQYAYIKGNPMLQPQINHQFTFSYTYKQQLTFGFDFSHSEKALGVSYLAADNITITTYDNFKGADIFYGYVNYYKTLLPFWQMNAYASAGYFSYNVNTAGYKQPKNKKPIYNFQASNSFDLKKGWSAECTIYYFSSIVSGIVKRDPYYYVNGGLSKTLFNKKLSVKASVSDIFNTQRTNTFINYQGVVSDNHLKEESRFIHLSMKYNFGNMNVRNKKVRQSKVNDINSRIIN